MNVRRLLVAASVLVGLSLGAYADTYVPDPPHTVVGFSVRHMGISTVRGQFGEYEGTVEYDGESVASLEIHADIQVASVNTATQKRDDHLRSAEYFDVENYPELVFHSKRVDTRDDEAVLVGDMTIKGVTKEIELAVEVAGPITDPWGNQRIGVQLTGSINRQDFGVAYDGMADKVVGDIIQIEVAIEGVKQ